MAAASHRQRLAAIVLVLVAVFSSPPAAAAPASAPAPVPEPFLHRAVCHVRRAGDQDNGGGGIMECWGALARLGACTSEILLFIFNGESYVGPECCRAIRGATRHCWPAVIAAVGFTAEQADVLRGFCDGEAAAGRGASAPPSAGTSAPPPGKL